MHGMLNAKKSHKIFVVNRPKNAKENLKKHFKTSNLKTEAMMYTAT